MELTGNLNSKLPMLILKKLPRRQNKSTLQWFNRSQVLLNTVTKSEVRKEEDGVGLTATGGIYFGPQYTNKTLRNQCSI